MTAILGTTFLGFQAFEFTSFVHEGLTIRTNLFGSSFFTLTGFHGAHVTAGVLWLLTLLAIDYQARAQPEGRAHRRHRGAVLALRRRRLDRDLHARLPDQVAPERRSMDTRVQAHEPRRPTATTRRWATMHEHPDLVARTGRSRSSSRSSPSSRSGSTTSRRSSRRALFVPTLLIMSALKFAIVVLFYMHLKYDHKLFRALFTGPLIIAWPRSSR